MTENRELKLLFFPAGPDRPAQGQLAAAEGRGRPQDHRPDPQGGRAGGKEAAAQCNLTLLTDKFTGN